MFNEDSPIYLQLRKHIEERILGGALRDEDAIPSLRIMAKDYKLNPITIGNAISALVELGVLYKKRGIGIFVSPGARERIIKMRSSDFIEEKLVPLIRLANQLEIPKQEIYKVTDTIYGGVNE